MKWMRFLALGRSFGPSRSLPHRYRLVQENLLPRFNVPPDDGAAHDTFPCPLPAETASLFDPKPVIPPWRQAAAALAERAPELEPGPVTGARPNPVFSEEAAAARRSARSWGLFSWWKRGATRDRRPLVQAELSLQTVKVVRNDLFDADLDIVPAAGGSARSESCPRPPAGGIRGESAWKRANHRLFEVCGPAA